jgi:hypothetical protein
MKNLFFEKSFQQSLRRYSRRKNPLFMIQWQVFSSCIVITAPLSSQCCCSSNWFLRVTSENVFVAKYCMCVRESGRQKGTEDRVIKKEIKFYLNFLLLLWIFDPFLCHYWISWEIKEKIFSFATWRFTLSVSTAICGSIMSFYNETFN